MVTLIKRMISSLYLPLMLIALITRLVRNSTSCGQLHIMRTFTLCCKRYNAQYSSTKIKAPPVRTDTAMQEMLANSFLERPTVVRLQQRRGRYIGADYNIIAVALHITPFGVYRYVLLPSLWEELYFSRLLPTQSQNTLSKI